MPLGVFRLGMFAWSERKPIGWLIAIATALLMTPLLFGVGVSAAVAGSPLPPGSPVRPMDSWLVSQPYGCTDLAFEPPRGGCAHFHSGIDLVAPAGSPVRAVLAGVAELVAPAGYGGGYGIHVVVHHDATTSTLYAHLLGAVIRTGQSLRVGELLGYEGSTGLSTGPHLHFEVRRLGVPVDPVAVFPSLFGSSAPASPRLPQPRPN